MSTYANESKDRIIAYINDNTTIGYKNMNFKGKMQLTLSAKCQGEGTFEVYTDDCKVGELEYDGCSEWTQKTLDITANGIKNLLFKFRGTGVAELMDFTMTA